MAGGGAAVLRSCTNRRRTRLDGKFSAWTASGKLEIRQDSCASLPCQSKNFLANPRTAAIGTASNSLADLNGQALARCNKVNSRVHAATNEVPFERLKKEGLNPLSREYSIDKINLRRVEKDCLISYAGNQYSVPAEYVGKDVAVVALDSMLAAYYEGKQIALHRISYQRKDMVVNPQHCRRLTLKQTMDAENVLLEQGKVIDFPLKPSDLSRYDEVLYD